MMRTAPGYAAARKPLRQSTDGAAVRRRRVRRRTRRIPRGWRHRLEPKLRGRPHGRVSAWKQVRRVLWWWWPYAALSVAAALYDEHGWMIGLAAVAIVNYLIAPAEAPPRYGLDHDFDIDAEEFLPTVAGASGSAFLGGNALEVLNNGDEFYPRMLDEIQGADASVTIEAYIYWAGGVGKEFAIALGEKAQQGVPVKILLDAVGSATIGVEILEILEKGGCQLAWYNPIHWYTIGRFNHRTHRKSLIVDGRVAFTGGAGIADHWRGQAQDPDHWRDMQIRLEGPAVAPLQTGFAHNWLQTTGELLSGAAYYPVHEPAGRLLALTITSSPELGASSVRTVYYLSMACARRSIRIANPYFIPDEVAIDMLVAAKRRGVDVRIMVSGVHNDSRLARWNSVRLYGALLEAGIPILEYNRTMLHHKVMVVDDVWCTIGTANFDNRSFAHNEESNVCVYDRDLAASLTAIFEEDVRGCDPVTLDAWRRRGFSRKVGELGASLLEAQV